MAHTVPRMVHMDAMADPNTTRIDDDDEREEGLINRALGAELRGWRNKRRMTLDDLEAASGVSKRTLSRLEAGERPMDMRQMYKLCIALRIRPSQLINAMEEEVGVNQFP